MKWEDISGLENAKQMLKESVILPSKRPELFTGISRSPPALNNHNSQFNASLQHTIKEIRLLNKADALIQISHGSNQGNPLP